MNVNIIVDSASDLPKSFYDEFQADMVPLLVHLNGQDYEDSRTIESETVYQEMRNGAAPKTAQATPESFFQVFKKYAEKGEPCVYLAFSSELSGTYQSAKIAEQQVKEEFPDAQLDVFDTKCASLGYGLVAHRAAKLAKDGASREKILEMAEYHASHMEHIFTVDDLEYLYRGGRVSRTQAFMGSLLKIKPLLHVEDGKLVPLEKIRGSKKVLKRMVEIMEERGDDINNQVIAISHGDDPDHAEKLAGMIREKFNPKEILIHTIGAAIGAHAGPGTIALFFLNDTYK
ncbi:MAG: DegV family protein [Bacillaceae bacterium]|nr:DegV family protein [Bacillaceae bacterium]